MTADRTFVVRLSRTEHKTVVLSGAHHDDAMARAARVFAGWDVLSAQETSARIPSPAEQAVIDRFGIFAEEEGR